MSIYFAREQVVHQLAGEPSGEKQGRYLRVNSTSAAYSVHSRMSVSVTEQH
jgi:hypothetical protein